MRARFLVGALSLLALGCVSTKRAARAQAQTELGTAYYREGNAEGAIETLRGAAKLDPRNWKAQNALAVVYIAKGQNDLAEDAFRKAEHINPGEAEILNNHGALQLKSGKTAEAIASFELALKDLDYRSPALIHSNLSYALLRAGRTDEALAWAREATRRAPTLCEGWFHLGLAQEARKDALGALDAYDHLVGACPTEALGARLRSGCIRLDAGMDDLGVAALEDVVRAAPGTAFADQARACLRTMGP